MNLTVLPRNHAPTNHATEIEYAAAMHFSASHLPSGSSPSLLFKQKPSAATSTIDHTTSFGRRPQRNRA